MTDSTDDLDQYLSLLQSLESDLVGNARDKFYATEEDRKAYHLHLQAFRAGKDFRLRAVLGGNRSGKSTLSVFELTCHLLGRYPEWWLGFRYTRPVKCWAASDTLNTLRDIIQAKLLGEAHSVGAAMIPKDSIVSIRKKQGITDSVDQARIKHSSGGISTVSFLPYAAGRQVFQGARVDFILLDEEPPWDVFEECLMRTAATSKTEVPGKILLAFTPLKGLSEVANFFLIDGQLAEVGDKFAMQIPWTETPHLSPEEQAELLASIPRHQRDARSKGIPSLGVGQIYQYDENVLICQPLKRIPRIFRRGYGMDTGWRATACVFVAENPDDGTFYVFDEYKGVERTPSENASVIRRKAATEWGDISGCIDPSARQRNQKDGDRLMDLYRAEDLHLVKAENAVYAGIQRVQTLMDEGRLRIYPHCTQLLAELRKYAWTEDGKVRKQDDHLLDSLRYICNTERALGRPRPAGFKPRVRTSMGST